MSNGDEEGAGQSQADSETAPETVPDTPDPPPAEDAVNVEFREGQLDRGTRNNNPENE